MIPDCDHCHRPTPYERMRYIDGAWACHACAPPTIRERITSTAARTVHRIADWIDP
jgi:hypothetical protein